MLTRKLNKTGIDALAPTDKVYSVSDGEGLSIQVTPKGVKTWRLRYRMNGRMSKHEGLSLGRYPAYSITDARQWLNDCKALIQRGISPNTLKTTAIVPVDAPAADRELADAFIKRWCYKKSQKIKAQRELEKSVTLCRNYITAWFSDVYCLTVKNHDATKSLINNDVFSLIGDKQLCEVTANDILEIISKIKERGASTQALVARNLLCRIFNYAKSHQVVTINPAEGIEGKHIAHISKRDNVITPEQLSTLIRGLYASQFVDDSRKYALHLLLITLVRKTELTHAKWNEFNLEQATWTIPADRMKSKRSHIVYLSTQAIELLNKLKPLSFGSEYVLPSNYAINKPIAGCTLNYALNAVLQDLGLDFNTTLHDFRRTSSTILNESGLFAPDWIERSLAHVSTGVRAVYNKAAYQADRSRMMQWYGDYIENLLTTNPD